LFTASATPEFGVSAMASTLSLSVSLPAMLTPDPACSADRR
jgi:hypothetical protein